MTRTSFRHSPKLLPLLILNRALSTVDDCRYSPVTALSFETSTLNRLSIVWPWHRRPDDVSSSNPQKIYPIKVETRIAPEHRGGGTSVLPSLAVASHLWICLFVSPTWFMSTPTLSHRGVTYFRHTPGASASQIARFSVLTRSALLICTSTWFSREPPRIRI